MEKMVKASLTLSGDAYRILASQASPRKRGELVTNLLIAYGAGAGGVDAVEIETQRLQMMGLSAANKTLEGRVLRLEKQLSAVIAGLK